MNDFKIQVHSLPSVIMLECQLPDKLVNDLNEYLDEYKEDPDRKSYAHSLVGQIHQGEQLLMEHTHELLADYSKFITTMGATYIQAFCDNTGATLKPRIVEIDEIWSVHSFEGDYNPIHDHGTRTVMGISTTCWTRVPEQIGKFGDKEAFTLKNDSGACDGFLSFTYGLNTVSDNERLKPPQSISFKPVVGRQLMFPCWMQHTVYPFFGEGERRSVAANLNCWLENEKQKLKKIGII